jgi:hypothetical protein
MKELTLEDFEAMKNRANLVPMTIRRSFAPYYKGATAGFPPRTAFKLYSDGDATPVSMPNAAPPPKSAVDTAAAAMRSTSVPSDRTAVTAEEEVEIPGDWQDGHAMKRVHLAAKLKGVAVKDISEMAEARSNETGEDVKTYMIADEIIAEEIARRAAEKK